jgi:hypothetical protein
VLPPPFWLAGSKCSSGPKAIKGVYSLFVKRLYFGAVIGKYFVLCPMFFLVDFISDVSDYAKTHTLPEI